MKYTNRRWRRHTDRNFRVWTESPDVYTFDRSAQATRVSASFLACQLCQASAGSVLSKALGQVRAPDSATLPKERVYNLHAKPRASLSEKKLGGTSAEAVGGKPACSAVRLQAWSTQGIPAELAANEEFQREKRWHQASERRSKKDLAADRSLEYSRGQNSPHWQR
eukprot:6485398-Amphidinium_carterae.1